MVDTEIVEQDWIGDDVTRKAAETRTAMIDLNGAAHIILTVSQWEKAHDFYSRLCPFLGMTKVYDGNNFLYHVEV